MGGLYVVYSIVLPTLVPFDNAKCFFWFQEMEFTLAQWVCSDPGTKVPWLHRVKETRPSKAI